MARSLLVRSLLVRSPMSRILGIDPGSRITGYGVVDMVSGRARHVASGSLKLPEVEIPERLLALFDLLSTVIEAHRPEEVAIEKIFFHKNAASALVLGQARGVALLVAARLILPIHEYSPTTIKQAVVGRGHADKAQVQHMVRLLLSLPENPAPDAADALAVALCHGHTRATVARIPGVSGTRAGRWR
jgi:crossover junction endodeoxyribonuclease RuvC